MGRIQNDEGVYIVSVTGEIMKELEGAEIRLAEEETIEGVLAAVDSEAISLGIDPIHDGSVEMEDPDDPQSDIHIFDQDGTELLVLEYVSGL